MAARVAPVVVVANPDRGPRQGRQAHRRRRLHPQGAAGRARGAGRGVGASELESTCRDAAERGAEIVAVIGGDGTVSCAANGLARHRRGARGAARRAPATTSPARSARPRSRPPCDCSRTRRLAAIDVVRVRAGGADRCFVNIAGAGFDSEVNETANAMTLRPRRHRNLRRGARRRRCRGSPRPATTSTIDGEPIVGRRDARRRGQRTSYGGGMKVLPDASIVDGVLDVCIVEALSKARLPAGVPDGVHRPAHDPSQGPHDARRRA